MPITQVPTIPIGQTENFELFSNIGYLDGVEGRLTAWLIINPTPELHWEFQVVDQQEFGQLLATKIPKEIRSSDRYNPNFVVKDARSPVRDGSSGIIRGSAREMIFGNPNEKADCFECYLTNTNFLRVITDSNLRNEEASHSAVSKFNIFIQALHSQLKTAKVIEDDWLLEFQTDHKSLSWLTPSNANRGSMITAKICLSRKINSTSDSKNLNEVKKIFSDLCFMLSYANGGHLSPVYITAKRTLSGELISSISAPTVLGLSTPQEELGESFVSVYGGVKDLVIFLECFPAFQKILKLSHWREKWILILEWYFQAIPRLKGRRRNLLLSVASETNAQADILLSLNANILGSLLENIIYLTWIADEPIEVKRKQTLKEFRNIPEDKKCNSPKNNPSSYCYNGRLEYRIDHYLRKIGISSDSQAAREFSRIRNNATHAEPKPTDLRQSPEEQNNVIQKALQWVDEILLQRLGYSGNYRERVSEKILYPNKDVTYSDRTISPRYALSK